MLRKHKDAQDIFCLFYIFVLECHANSVLRKTYESYISGVLCLTGKSDRGTYSNEYQSEIACIRQACISFNKHGCKMHYFVISGARDLTKCVLRRSG